MIDGDPWFVASDMCRCLELTLHKGTYMHLKKLAGDEKRLIVKRYLEDPRSDLGSLFVGTDSQHVIISESGLYKLILRCDKPIAAKFQDWVTREVLPAIRKAGGYLLNENMRETAAADSRAETGRARRSPPSPFYRLRKTSRSALG
jgi:prophage antirepressor-like protein